MSDPGEPGPLGPGACSAVSLLLAEPLAGTATEAERWLLLEQPGPWGRKVFTESRLDPSVASEIVRRCDEGGMRAGLIRRAGAESAKRSCVIAETGAASMRRIWFTDPRELLDADLEQDGEVATEPVFLVCTNARRDACCAVYGRAAYRALSAARPAATWETSHVGGHRFAANLICMPHGYAYGRLRADTIVDVASAYERGELALENLRGRTCLPAAAQAAECFLRRELAATGVDDVTHLGDGLVFESAGARYRVVVDTAPADTPRIESCSIDELVSPIAHRLLRVDAVT